MSDQQRAKHGGAASGASKITCRTCGCLNFSNEAVCDNCRQRQRQHVMASSSHGSTNGTAAARPFFANQRSAREQQRNGTVNGETHAATVSRFLGRTGPAAAASSSVSRIITPGASILSATQSTSTANGETATATGLKRRRVEKQTREIINLISSDEDDDEDESTTSPASKALMPRSALRVVDEPARDTDRIAAPSGSDTRGPPVRELFQSRCFDEIEFKESDFPPVDVARRGSIPASVSSIASSKTSEEATDVAATQADALVDSPDASSTVQTVDYEGDKAIVERSDTMQAQSSALSDTSALPTALHQAPPTPSEDTSSKDGSRNEGAANSTTDTANAPESTTSFAQIPIVLDDSDDDVDGPVLESEEPERHDTEAQQSVSTTPVNENQADQDEGSNEEGVVSDITSEQEGEDEASAFLSRQFDFIEFNPLDFAMSAEEIRLARRSGSSRPADVEPAPEANQDTASQSARNAPGRGDGAVDQEAVVATGEAPEGSPVVNQPTANVLVPRKKAGASRKPDLPPPQQATTSIGVSNPDEVPSAPGTSSSSGSPASQPAAASSVATMPEPPPPPAVATTPEPPPPSPPPVFTTTPEPAPPLPATTPSEPPPPAIPSSSGATPDAPRIKTEHGDAIKQKTPAKAPEPIRKPALGHCSTDFLSFMRECGDASNDSEDDEELVRAKLRQTIDLTFLSDESDVDDDNDDDDGDDPRVVAQSSTFTPAAVGARVLSLNPSEAVVMVARSDAVPGIGSTSEIAPIKPKRVFPPRPKETCVLCEEKGWVKSLVHCATCKKYSHKRCAREYGDESVCWNCQLDDIIDDTELTEQDAEQVVGMLSTFRESSDSESGDGDTSDGGEMEQEEKAATPVNRVAMRSTTTKSMRRWKEFLEVSTATVDAGFEDTTRRIQSDLQDAERKRLYTSGFTTKEMVDAAMDEVVDHYAELQEREERPRLETPVVPPTASTTTAAAVAPVLSDSPVTSHHPTPAMPVVSQPTAVPVPTTVR